MGSVGLLCIDLADNPNSRYHSSLKVEKRTSFKKFDDRLFGLIDLPKSLNKLGISLLSR